MFYNQKLLNVLSPIKGEDDGWFESMALMIFGNSSSSSLTPSFFALDDEDDGEGDEDADADEGDHQTDEDSWLATFGLA